MMDKNTMNMVYRLIYIKYEVRILYKIDPKSEREAVGLPSM